MYLYLYWEHALKAEKYTKSGWKLTELFSEENWHLLLKTVTFHSSVTRCALSLSSRCQCLLQSVGRSHEVSNSQPSAYTRYFHYAEQFLRIDNHDIPCVSQVSDLGITVDTRLKFSTHVSNICVKAHRKAYLILRCFESRNISFLTAAFKTYVRDRNSGNYEF